MTSAALLDKLRIHDNPIRDRYAEPEVNAACEVLCSATGLISLAKRIVEDAGRHGWVDGGGKVHYGVSYYPPGETTGGIHAFNTRTVYDQVPNDEFVRDFIMDQGNDVVAGVLLHLLNKYQTDRKMKWEKGQEWWPECGRYLAQRGEDAFGRDYGDPSCEVRAKPPDDNCEVMPPEVPPPPKDGGAQDNPTDETQEESEE